MNWPLAVLETTEFPAASYRVFGQGGSARGISRGAKETYWDIVHNILVRFCYNRLLGYIRTQIGESAATMSPQAGELWYS